MLCELAISFYYWNSVGQLRIKLSDLNLLDIQFSVGFNSTMSAFMLDSGTAKLIKIPVTW